MGADKRRPYKNGRLWVLVFEGAFFADECLDAFEFAFGVLSFVAFVWFEEVEEALEAFFGAQEVQVVFVAVVIAFVCDGECGVEGFGVVVSVVDVEAVA